MEAAEQWEPDDTRVSRPVLRELGGAIPPRHSPLREDQRQAPLSLAPVDHEGEVLEAVVTAKRDKAAALKLLERIMKTYGRPRTVVTDGLAAYSAAMKEIGQCRSPGGWPTAQQSCGEFASAVSKTREGDAAVSQREGRSSVQSTPRCTTISITSGIWSRGKSARRDARPR
jgi:hypothetical protein